MKAMKESEVDVFVLTHYHPINVIITVLLVPQVAQW